MSKILLVTLEANVSSKRATKSAAVPKSSPLGNSANSGLLSFGLTRILQDLSLRLPRDIPCAAFVSISSSDDLSRRAAAQAAQIVLGCCQMEALGAPAKPSRGRSPLISFFPPTPCASLAAGEPSVAWVRAASVTWWPSCARSASPLWWACGQR